MTDIQVGDVCLDLAQGRPVHVVEDTGQDAATWSEANDYELAENYGNSRLDTQPDDHVYEVVYCSSIKSEPSKTYAMPASRLARVETEAADDGRPVYDRVVVEVLDQLFQAASGAMEPDNVDLVAQIARDAGVGEDLVAEAQELAEAATLDAGGDA